MKTILLSIVLCCLVVTGCSSVPKTDGTDKFTKVNAGVGEVKIRLGIMREIILTIIGHPDQVKALLDQLTITSAKAEEVQRTAWEWEGSARTYRAWAEANDIDVQRMKAQFWSDRQIWWAKAISIFVGVLSIIGIVGGLIYFVGSNASILSLLKRK